MKSAAVILFIIFITLGCSQKQPKQFTIGFSQCTGSDNWRRTMHENMQRELSFHPEINFVMKDAAGQSAKQIEQIQQLIDQQVDLLIVSPNEAKKITPIVEKAYQKGIPVIILDRRTMSDQYTAYVGAENIEVGRTAGIYANNVLKGKGNVVEISELPGSSADIDRHKGFIETIKRFPKIHLVAKLDGNWDKYSFENKLTALLKSDRRMDFIYCQNDRRAITAFEICKKLGFEKRVKIIGVDGLNGKNEGIDLVDRAILNATIIYPTGGEESIRTAINILEKQPFKRENRLQSTLIDSSNVRIMKLQNQKVTAQQEDIERRQRKIEEQRAISENQSSIIYAISITLALALLFGALSFYSLRENRKINRRLEKQNHEILNQRDQISQMAEKATVEHEAKLKFFTNISHEFRTPLTLILAPVQDLLDNGKIKDSLVQQELNLIKKNAFRLLRLVNQLMDFRKIEGHKMMIRASEHNLISFLKDIMTSFEKTAVKRKIDFRLVTSEPKVIVWFDANMLDKVLFNLLSNAFKFTPDKGRIYIYVKIIGDGIKIVIEDNGKGMIPSEVEHAFEIFYQGEGSYKTLGTGLGLALSKELINLHHGTISVESQQNKETKFTIELPLGKAHFEPSEIWDEPTDEISLLRSMELPELEFTESQEIKPAVQHQHTVLLIEDNEELIRLVEQKLQENYLIVKSNNGEDGLKMAFDQIPDLIVCDIMLPGKDGLQVASVLKSDFRTSHIPIILLTAKSTTEQQIEGIQSGVDAYITKPFNLKFVDETIKTLLRNRSLLREHYTSELPIVTASAGNASKLDKKFVTAFTAYIEEHYGNSDLNVEDIAKDMGMSRVQLYRKVKALLGFSVNEYIQQIRLNKARYLLRRNDLTVADIAYSVGFSSPTYFSTAFKAKYNQTPLEYKNA
ncbi:substrate-binding domain-containing protein [Dyadobacter sp. UP-52]|uniref:histidine kinase n=3 Tax=Dyadobacter subterraneus TaxID=2773304 RepID=A0ABR9WEE9_9BACT|nr:substrate-binding domain-containing protein [Dyadobacter subterraneus]